MEKFPYPSTITMMDLYWAHRIGDDEVKRAHRAYDEKLALHICDSPENWTDEKIDWAIEFLTEGQ